MARKRKWDSLSKVSKTPRLFKDYLVEDNWKRKNRDKLDATNIKGKNHFNQTWSKNDLQTRTEFPIADFLG